MSEREPLHVEHRRDPIGEYEVRWMIKPPAMDTSYRVLEDSWSKDFSVRMIRRIQRAAGFAE